MFEASRNTVVFTFQTCFFKNKNKKGLLADVVYTWLNHRLDRTQLGQNRAFSLVLGHAVLLVPIYIILLPDYFIFWCTVLVRYYNIF